MTINQHKHGKLEGVMVETLKKCPACDGRGYFRCECWPGDCICGVGDEDCDECGGEGIIDESYDPWDGYDPQR